MPAGMYQAGGDKKIDDENRSEDKDPGGRSLHRVGHGDKIQIYWTSFFFYLQICICTPVDFCCCNIIFFCQQRGGAAKLEKVEITLADCLACSGCITSAESVLITQQSQEELLRVFQEKKDQLLVAKILCA